MIAKKVKLGCDTVKALILANVAGPNCETDMDKLSELVKKISSDREINLYDLSRYFDKQFGPISTIINYIAKNWDCFTELDKEDIGWIYCHDHMQIVQASRIHIDDDYKSDYFQMLRDNGFIELNKDSKWKYLYSCMGKIGKVVATDGDFITVIDECGVKLIGIFNAVEANIDDRVAFHYAGTFLKFDNLDDYHFILKNFPKAELLYFVRKMSRKTINYKRWLNGNLSQWTCERIKKLPF